MRHVERMRNWIESSPGFGTMYAGIGALPGYRRFLMKRVNERIAYLERTRRYGVMIETSSVCNARCVFCPHSNNGLGRKREVMSDEVFDIIVERLRRERIAPPTIDLFDVGEPLVDKGLFSRVRVLKAAFPTASIRITTNFSLANDLVIGEVLASGLDSVHISLNASNREDYERIMGLNWDKTLQNVNSLIERRNETGSPLRIVLGMVLCQESSKEARVFVKQWSGKVDSVLLQRAVDWGGNVNVAGSYRASMRLYPCNDLFERIVILTHGDEFQPSDLPAEVRAGASPCRSASDLVAQGGGRAPSCTLKEAQRSALPAHSDGPGCRVGEAVTTSPIPARGLAPR